MVRKMRRSQVINFYNSAEVGGGLNVSGSVVMDAGEGMVAGAMGGLDVSLFPSLFPLATLLYSLSP